MAVPWTPWIHSHATRSKPLAIPVPPLAAPPRPLVTKTRAQIEKDTYARRISDKWPISRYRRNKASRGLLNIGNTCYQSSALQPLFHLRKFMNWILTHNVPRRGDTIQNPCDPEMRVANGCVACVLKNLIGKYWGNNDLTAGIPNTLSINDLDMAAMQRIADFWYPLIADRTTGEFTYRPQQDAEEFQMQVLQACVLSTNIIDQTDGWQEGFHALFSLEYAETWRCGSIKCGQYIPVTPNSRVHTDPEIGFLNLSIRKDVPETVRTVIDERLADELVPANLIETICPHCWTINPAIRRQFRIEAAPELLRIALRLGTRDSSDSLGKEFNPVQYAQYLDLTDLQRDQGAPLRYRLSSVVHHQGRTLNGGHWISTVQGHGTNIYYINDDVVRRENNAFFTLNPQTDPVPASILADKVAKGRTQNQREAVILMYVRQR